MSPPQTPRLSLLPVSLLIRLGARQLQKPIAERGLLSWFIPRPWVDAPIIQERVGLLEDDVIMCPVRGGLPRPEHLGFLLQRGRARERGRRV